MSPAATVPDFLWRADGPDADRHAFPQRDGYPARSLCDRIRWSVRFGEHGARYCDSCLLALKKLLAGAQEALNEATFTNATRDLAGWAEAEKREAFGG